MAKKSLFSSSKSSKEKSPEVAIEQPAPPAKKAAPKAIPQKPKEETAEERDARVNLVSKTYDSLYNIGMTKKLKMEQVQAWTADDQQKVLDWALVQRFGPAEKKAALEKPAVLG